MMVRRHTFRTWDDYYIPGTTVLRNKFTGPDKPYGETNEKKLQGLEEFQAMTKAVELAADPVNGSFDYDHMKEIHRRLFADAYEWAGQERVGPVDFMRKEGHAYYKAGPPLTEAANAQYAKLASKDLLRGLAKDEFVTELAEAWGEINVIHSFREGNTRSQFVFFSQLAEQAGYNLDSKKFAQGEPLRDAFVKARFHGQDTGRNDQLAEVLSQAITPITHETPAPPVSGFDVQLREERVGSDNRKYERQSEEFDQRRTAFITKHGVTPEEWGKERAQAQEKHQKAQENLAVIRDNAQDTAEHQFRTEYVRDATELNQVRESADSAGMFSKRQAKAELDTALNTFEARYDYRPNASISPEPSIRRIQQVRREALSSQSPEVAKAETIEAQARAKYERMKDIDPKTFHESKRPLAPSVGTPDQEVAKDKAFAGRRAQNQRLKTQDRTASPTLGQQNTHNALK